MFWNRKKKASELDNIINEFAKEVDHISTSVHALVSKVSELHKELSARTKEVEDLRRELSKRTEFSEKLLMQMLMNAAAAPKQEEKSVSPLAKAYLEARKANGSMVSGPSGRLP